MDFKKLLLPCIAGLGLVSPVSAQTLAARPAVAESAPEAAKWHVQAGAGFYLLQPYSGNNPAYSLTTSDTRNAGNSVSGTSRTEQFGWSMQPALEAWVEATSPSGLGLRARYFYLDSTSNRANLSVPSSQYNSTASPLIAVTPSQFLINSPPGTVPQQNPALAGLFGGPSPFVVNFPGAPASVDRFAFRSELRINTGDLELSGVLYGDQFELTGGLGGRYFQMTQSYGATLINSNGAGAVLSESLDSSRRFEGGGPTLSAQLRWHPITENLSLFAGGRGSFVVGQVQQTTTGNRTLNDPMGAFNPIGSPTSISNSFSIPNAYAETIPIAELELGAEYAVIRKTCTMFVRGAAVEQTYFGAGNATRADGNLSLLGFKVTGGITY